MRGGTGCRRQCSAAGAVKGRWTGQMVGVVHNTAGAAPPAAAGHNRFSIGTRDILLSAPGLTVPGWYTLALALRAAIIQPSVHQVGT